MEVLTGNGEEGIGVALASGLTGIAHSGLTGGGGEGLEMLTRDGGEGVEVTGGGGKEPEVLTGGEAVEIEFRNIDLEEQQVVEEFCLNGCGCSMNRVTQFSLKHFLLPRANANQMHRSELDMALMGQVMAFTFCSQVPQNSTSGPSRERETWSCFTTMEFECARTPSCSVTLGIFISEPLGPTTSLKVWSHAFTGTLAALHLMCWSWRM